jgi:hypothetical protein
MLASMGMDPTLALPTAPLSIAAAVLALAGIAFAVAGIAALWRRRPLAFAAWALTGGLLLALGALAGSLALGIQGYRALTHEEVAARIEIRPLGPQRFEATVHGADGTAVTHELAGDEIYIDAHILKWKPVGNLLGLHTLWSLDRIAGRYRSIEQERTAPRTVHPLAPDRPLDLFALRRRHAALSPLYDAEHGSASFLPVTGPATLELRITTSGLLLRAQRPAEPDGRIPASR